MADAGTKRWNLARPGGRWRRRLILGFVLVAGALAAAVYLSPAALIKWSAQYYLLSQGLSPVSLNVEEADFRHLVVRHLTVGSAPDLAIGTLEVEFRPWELIRGQVRRVTLDEVVLQGRVGATPGSGETARLFSLGVLDRVLTRLLPAAGGEGPAGDAAPPSPPALVLTNGRLRVRTPMGVALWTFAVDLEADGRADASLTLDDVQSDPAVRLSVERFGGAIHRASDGRLDARFALAVKEGHWQGSSLRDLVLTVAYQDEPSAAQAGSQGRSAGEIALAASLSLSQAHRQGVLARLALDHLRESVSPSPLAAPLVEDVIAALEALLVSARISGRLAIARAQEGYALSFGAPLVLAGTSPDSPDVLQITLDQGEEAQPFLTFMPDSSWQTRINGVVTVAGGSLPDSRLALSASWWPFTPSGAAAARRFDVGALTLEVAPWQAGPLTLGVQDLTVALQGTPAAFSGRLSGGVSIAGAPLAGLDIGEGVVSLAGRFARDDLGFFFAREARDCLSLSARTLRLAGARLDRPALAFCPLEATPLLRVLFSEGGAAELQFNAVMPPSPIRMNTSQGTEWNGRLPELRLDAEYLLSEQQWRLTYDMSGGSLSSPSYELSLGEMELTGILSGVAGRLEEAVTTLDRLGVWDDAPFSRFAPLAITSRLSLEGEEGQLSGHVKGDADRILLEISGRYDRATDMGRVEAVLPPLVFEPQGFQPHGLLPFLKGVVADVSGTITGRAEGMWRQGALTSSAHLSLGNLGMATAIGPVKGINGEIDLASLIPPITQKPQSIHIDDIDIGINLAFGTLSFSLTPDGRLVLEQAEWPWAGGVLGAEKTELFLDGRPQSLVLTAKDIDLEEVALMLDVDGLKGTGRLNGRLPVVIDEGDVEIRDGMLTSAPGGGTLQYRGQAGQVAAQEEGSSLLFNALQDFHYDELTVLINGRTSDVLSVTIKLNGYNPDVLEGYPIKLNITTEGPLVDMIRQGTIGYRMPERIRRELQKEQ